MPGEEAILRGQTRDGEDLNRLICEQRCEDPGCRAWVVQYHRGHIHDAPVAITQRTVGAHQLANAMAASGGRAREWFVRHGQSPFSGSGRVTLRATRSLLRDGVVCDRGI